MAHWLWKSEPFKYSWDQLVADGRTHWNGVRNFQAANNLKAMRSGEHGFFYHSNEGLEIVGIAEIVKEYYPDPSDATGRFGMVDIKPVRRVPKPVTLQQIKAEPKLADFALVRQSRLSVVPVSDAEWELLYKMAGLSG
ncbi:MAG: EVE domain-containing protein [Alphaproteobacteria bacterium]|nr:EVE domain-containing protein [Alphaproteobacteria bacterium]